MKLQNKIKLKYYLLELFFNTSVFTLIGLFAWFNNKILETVFIFICFNFLRYAFHTTFHSKSLWYCLLWSVIIYWVAIPITFPAYVSIFASVIIGFAMTYLLYKIQCSIELHTEQELKILKLNKRLNELLTIIDKPHKNIYAMSKEELYQHCRDCGLDDIECKVAYYAIIERLKGQEFYDAIGYSSRQAKRKRKQVLDTIS